MHRPVDIPIWGTRDAFRSHNAHLNKNTGGAGTLSLRERMHRNQPDYFNVGDVRGSSPAASLAADLSQNFRLDSEARLASSVHWYTCLLLTSLVLDSLRHDERSLRPTSWELWSLEVRWHLLIHLGPLG
jgi:hypothetical protein